MSLKPLPIELLELPTQEKTSASSDIPAQFNTDTVIMPDPSAEGNCDIETSVPVQWHTTETSIAIQPKSREGDSFGPPARRISKSALALY